MQGVFIIITITMCANLKMTISRSMSTYPSDSKNLCAWLTTIWRRPRLLMNRGVSICWTVSSSSQHSAKLGQKAISRQKLNPKNHEIDWSYWYACIDLTNWIWSARCYRKRKWKLGKTCETTSIQFIFGGFYLIGTTVLSHIMIEKLLSFWEHP